MLYCKEDKLQTKFKNVCYSISKKNSDLQILFKFSVFIYWDKLKKKM